MPFGVNQETGKPGPAPMPPRDGDMLQARQRINVEVRTGYRPHPNQLPCALCGHVWREGERRHEYDHYLGYAPEHHYTVRAVCKLCHERAHRPKHCPYGHEYTPENTVVKRVGGIDCRECRRARDRKRKDAEFWRKRRERLRG